MTNFNFCDRCATTHDTNDLIWITADDFDPLDGEIVPEELYKKYDALCEECYLSLIQGGHNTKHCTCANCSSIS